MDLRIDNITLQLETNTDGQATWGFATPFEDDPIVTAILVGGLADANVYISAISKAHVIFQTNLPAEFVGAKIYAHAISATARRRSPPMILSGS